MSNPKPFEHIAHESWQKRRPAHLAKVERKLQVLHVGKYYPPHPGGMESHLEALCGELKRTVDLEVVVAASNGSGTKEELIDEVPVTRLGKLFNLRSAPFCPQMVRKIRESNADIIHIHLPNPGAILAYLASGHRGRLVVTYHSDVIRQRVLNRFFDPILRHALNRADAIIVSSPNYIDSSDVLRRFRDKCRVIPFGIPLDPFLRPDHAQVTRLRRLYGPRIVLGVGRLVYYKGFAHLIEAMQSVQGRLVIVGSGPLQSTLEQKAESCGVKERVTFLTNVEDVSPYYHAADVFALPSVARSEAFGIVQLEAMACGKPVVNTNLDSGVPFVSLDGVSGVTVPPADSAALGQAISSLLDDPLRSIAYGRAGQRRVKQHFSLQEMAGQTLDLYREATSRAAAKNIRVLPTRIRSILKPGEAITASAESIAISGLQRKGMSA
jgi:glycosyltransferase involved in cell wall biosynthesis